MSGTQATSSADGQSSDQKVRPYSVILCRGEVRSPASIDDPEDEYEKSLHAIGMSDVRTLPLLRFQFRDQQLLMEKLNRCDDYTGLILTSPRAVEAIREVATTDLLIQWSRKEVFTVGPKTAKLAHAIGLTNRKHEEVAGNSKILALAIVKLYESKHGIRFLMPCSSIARDDLPLILSQNQIQVDQVFAYDTIPTDDAPQRLESAVRQAVNSNVFVVFFSPSNVNAVGDVLRLLCPSKKVSFVCIGPTTGAALESKGLPFICNSAQPNAESLAKTILTTIQSDCSLSDSTDQKRGTAKTGILAQQKDESRNDGRKNTDRSLPMHGSRSKHDIRKCKRIC